MPCENRGGNSGLAAASAHREKFPKGHVGKTENVPMHLRDYATVILIMLRKPQCQSQQEIMIQESLSPTVRVASACHAMACVPIQWLAMPISSMVTSHNLYPNPTIRKKEMTLDADLGWQFAIAVYPLLFAS